MSVLNFTQSKIRLPPLLALGIAAALILIHIGISIKTAKYSHLAISLVFWLAVISLIDEKKKQIVYQSNLFSFGLGIIIISSTLFLGAAINRNLFLSFAPFSFALGLALLVSGLNNLGDYRQELIILFTLGIPRILLPLIPDIAPITAKFSAFWLLYCGFDVTLIDTKILLPQGAVEVVPSCSGLNLILYMLGLSVIFLMMFPLKNKTYKTISCLAAAIIGFFVNSIRVAILALLSGKSTHQAFEYWHSQEGALVFVTLSVIIYGIFCWLMLRHNFLSNQNQTKIN